jgi:hypothetical protein
MSDDLTLFSSPELKDVVQDMQSCSRRVVWRSCSEPDAVKTWWFSDEKIKEHADSELHFKPRMSL